MARTEGGLVVWFTGLSGAGKSTIAERAARMLREQGVRVAILDGDDIRLEFGSGLGYTLEDVRRSNALALELTARRRANEDVILVTRVAPLEDGRRDARALFRRDLIEVYVHATLGTVTRRDPKGLYVRAAHGGAPAIGMPGAVPYEPPRAADLVLDTERLDERALAEELARCIADRLAKRVRT